MSFVYLHYFIAQGQANSRIFIVCVVVQAGKHIENSSGKTSRYRQNAAGSTMSPGSFSNVLGLALATMLISGAAPGFEI